MGKNFPETFASEESLPSGKKQRHCHGPPDSESLRVGVKIPTVRHRVWCINCDLRGKSSGQVGLAFKLNYARVFLAEFVESCGGNHTPTLKILAGLMVTNYRITNIYFKVPGASTSEANVRSPSPAVCEPLPDWKARKQRAGTGEASVGNTQETRR